MRATDLDKVEQRQRRKDENKDAKTNSKTKTDESN